MPWVLKIPGRKQPVTHVSQVSEYSLGCQSYRAWIYMVVSMPRLHMVLHKLYFKVSHYFECLEFWICWGFECIRSLNMLKYFIVYIWQGFEYTTVPKYVRVLNMSGFIKKTLHYIDAWQGTDYSSGSVYTRVQNMLGLHKPCKKMLDHRSLTDSKYSSGSEHAMVLNMPGLRKVLNKMLHYRYLIGFWICL